MRPSDNNYRAPFTRVEDPPEENSGARPRSVSIALAILAAVVLLQLLWIIRNLQEVQFRFEHPMEAVGLVADFFIYAGLLYAISRAKNWARVVLLILTLLIFAELCAFFVLSRHRSAQLLDMLLTVEFAAGRLLPLIGSFVALFLLFFPGGAWFRRR